MRMRTRCMLALLALLALRCIAALDTAGYAPADDAAAAAAGAADRPPVSRVRVGDGVPGVRCAESAAELAPLLAVTLEPDIATWARGGGGGSAGAVPAAPYTMADWEALVREGAGRFDTERIVLIYNNSWYYFAHARAAAVATPRGATPETGSPFVSAWVTATQWWFEEAVSAWNMTFPDCVFHMDVNDEGYCVPPRRCPAPSFALWRPEGANATDIMLPYMYGMNHSTYDVPWAEKDSRAFFRGRQNDHTRTFADGRVARSRSALVNLSASHSDMMDARFIDGKDAVPEVSIRDHARHKYLLALDGITGSFRLSRLLWCNSLVLKEASPWHEYYYRGLKPGVHYHSVFETAPDDVLGVVARARADDSGSEAIARAGQAFAARYLCPRARMVYIQAALRAYVRLFEGDSMGTYAREQAWPVARERIRGEAALAALRAGSASAAAAKQASLYVAAPPAYYSGKRCFPHCEHPSGRCPQVGMCSPNSSCVLWRLGEFQPLPLPPLPVPCSAVDRSGTFDAAGVFTPSLGGTCTPAMFSPAQAYAALRGRHIAFGGDSLMRQFFLRLVAHLRGFTAVADRTFHAPALYRRNATHDSLHIGFRGNEQSNEPQPPPLPLRTRVAADEVLLTFEWAPSHNSAHADGAPYTTPVEELLAAEPGAPPPVVVYGIIYWHDAAKSLDDALPALSALAANASRLFWVATPDVPNGDPKTAEQNAAFAARNAAMRAWAAAQAPPGRVRVLPLDALAMAAKAHGAAVRPGGVHFACGLHDGRSGALGAYAYQFAPLRDDAIGPGDCRDVVNLALVQLLLNALQD